ncbi:MAG: phage/plasmid primase, P4 family [Acetatifactor sp.]|nr:phage/plasmid primase, P4 family [Acetatifactor sp.]
MGDRKSGQKKILSIKSDIWGCKHRAPPKRNRDKTSLFEDDDCDFECSVELSKWDKAYQGELSALGDVEFENEHVEASGANKQKHRASPKRNRDKTSLFEDDDCDFECSVELSKWDKAYQGELSALGDVEFENEYVEASGANKQKHRASPKRESVFGNDDDFGAEEHTGDIPPVIHAESRVIRKEDTENNASEDDAECLALQIAEDLTKKENIRIIGGALYIFNGKFYVLLDDETVQRMIFANYRKEVGQKNTVSILRNAATLLRYCVKKVYEEFPVNSNLIVFENGTLEVDTGNFRKNSPKDLACSALGIHYISGHCKMPHIKYFLETIANGDDSLLERMLQMIGYILSNDIKAKSFFYLEGVGDAGKSRFCDLIASFFPLTGANKVARIALQDLGGKFALGNLVNAKLNISEDLPDSPLSPTTVSRIKMLSDSNRLEAEAKYVQPFSFRPTCKLLFASNHPLRLKEYDEAFMNRVVYIPFMHAIPKHKQDKNILEKMQRELPMLFNHAFDAYKRLVANGYVWAGADKFKPSIAIVGSGITINKEQSLKHFVDACCIFQNSSITSTADLQAEYGKFCREKGYTPVMGDRFSRELLTVLPETVTRTKIGNQRRGFKGIRLKKMYEDDVF